jgi:hypothetical protein
MIVESIFGLVQYLQTNVGPTKVDFKTFLTHMYQHSLKNYIGTNTLAYILC